jgi:hypothetical protein
MDTQQAKFDWIAWYASIPGIPAGWGASPGTAFEEQAEPEIPLLEAA